MEALLVNLVTVIGEETRARILWHLMDGRFHTARELALLTDVSPQGMSNHLKKLLEAGLIKVEVRGRHRYFQYDRPEVGYAVEALMNLLPRSSRTGEPPANGNITYARTCYNHLAGYLGVVVCKSFVEQGLVTLQGKVFTVTDQGAKWFVKNDINRKASKKVGTCSPACLDWTERRYHIGGTLGAGLLHYFMEKECFRKKPNERILVLTSSGEKVLQRLGIDYKNHYS